MCLATYQQEPKIAKQGIVCYKQLNLTKSKDTFISTIRKHPWNLNELTEAELGITRTIIKGKIDTDALVYIDEGLHAYTKEKYAQSWDGGDIIAKCIIPKGSEYFVSYSGVGIVSNKMIIKKIIYVK